ncbi:hypothetical protein AgCh_015235 [Apium graveolens]
MTDTMEEIFQSALTLGRNGAGGLPRAKKFSSTETLIGLLKKLKELNRPYGAICASSGWVLEPHGLLNVLSLTISAFCCKTL